MDGSERVRVWMRMRMRMRVSKTDLVGRVRYILGL